MTKENPKAAAILFSYLSRLSLECPDHDVGKTKYPFAFVFALAVFADDIRGQAFLTVNGVFP